MRALRVATASALLAGGALVVPVVSVGATPHAVSPSVDRVPVPAGRLLTSATTDSTAGSASARPARGPSADPTRGAAKVESLLTRDTDEVDVVGIRFPDRASADGVVVAVRSRSGGAWGPWTEIGLSDSAPDSGTEEASQAATASEPVGVTGSDRVQVRVRSTKASARLDRLTAVFVGGGSSAADSAVGRMPAARASASVAQPTIITRAQWGADESLRTCTPSTVPSIKGGIVHHTVNSNTYTAEDVPRLLRGIYAYHVTGNGWCDVGYNFFVDRFGRLFEGRYGGVSRNVVGAQAAGFNSQSFGVSSLGNHDPGSAGAVAPSSAVLTAVGKLFAWKGWLNGWNPQASVSYTSAGSSKWPAGTVITKPRVSGHRDFNLTTCPGDLMFGKLDTIRSTATAVYSGVAASPPPTSTITGSSVVETYTRPAGSSFTLAGRGFGHGLGMSQYGAYGAAIKGLTRDQILAFYYPGTTRSTSLGNPSIRVRLTVLGSKGTQVVHQGGLAVSDGTTTALLTGTNSDGTPRLRWRVVPDGSGLTLQWLQDGSWRSTSSWKQVAGPLSFQNTTLNKVRVVLPNGVQRDYRRVVRTVRSGSAAMSLSVVPLNYYLQSVVPSEMPPSWSRAALEVQSVAARTFALHQKSQKGSGALYDTCDSTACQVYKGLAGYSSSGAVTPYENPATTAAVTATSGMGMLYGGAPALTQFSSSNGGQTVDSPLAYQVSKVDPYDAVPTGSPSRWTASLPVSKVESAFPSTGTLKALRINRRDGINQWGGRIQSITVIGSTGSATVSGSALRTALGLRSTWWTVTSAPATSAASFPKDLDGNRLADLLAVDGSGQLRLLSGNGTQGFSAKVMAKAWGDVRLVSNVGAWDGDNRHDVVERDAGTLYYHPGNGAGGLFPRVRISSGWDTINLVTGTGDFDGDRHTDFLARTTSGQLKLYRGNGKGGVLGTLLVGSGWNAHRLVVAPGDLTGDNRPDVLAVRASDNALLLFPGTGTGAVAGPVRVAGSWGGYTALMGLGDMSGDGRDDVVGRRSSDGALVLLHGNDDRTLTPGAVVSGTATWATWTRWAP